MSARNDSSAPPASAQGLEPTTTLTTALITTVASMCTTTAATITSFVRILQASPASSTAAVTTNTGQRPGATASLSGATAATRTLSPSASPSRCNDDQAEVQGDNAGRARVTVAVVSVRHFMCLSSPDPYTHLPGHSVPGMLFQQQPSSVTLASLSTHKVSITTS